jgi:hypothetical protein
MIATFILGVVASTVILAWLMWRVRQSVERGEGDAKDLRRRLRWLGLIYAGGSAVAVVAVATRQEPVEILIGVPVGLLLAWFWFQTASRVGIPGE